MVEGQTVHNCVMLGSPEANPKTRAQVQFIYLGDEGNSLVEVWGRNTKQKQATTGILLSRLP